MTGPASHEVCDALDALAVSWPHPANIHGIIAQLLRGLRDAGHGTDAQFDAWGVVLDAIDAAAIAGGVRKPVYRAPEPVPYPAPRRALPSDEPVMHEAYGTWGPIMPPQQQAEADFLTWVAGGAEDEPRCRTTWVGRHSTARCTLTDNHDSACLPGINV